VKESLDKALEGEEKDAIVARLLLEDTEKRTQAEQAAERRSKVVDAILGLRKKFPAISNEEIRKAREEGRP
jgi:hypothetical protein